jgi:hypothetical protein
LENIKGINHLKDTGVQGRIILKWMCDIAEWIHQAHYRGQ